MKDASRLQDRLQHMADSIDLACSYVEGLQRQDFLNDKRTQQAVILSNDFPGFVAQHPDIPWTQMRGMRNRMAHGYFDIDLNVVWDTVQLSLRDLRPKLQLLL